MEYPVAIFNTTKLMILLNIYQSLPN